MDTGDDEVTADTPVIPTLLEYFADRTPSRHTPEYRLVAAVMCQAVQDFAKSNPVLQKSARRWVQAPSDRPFTFRWCCDYLNISADRARARFAREIPDNLRRGHND